MDGYDLDFQETGICDVSTPSDQCRVVEHHCIGTFAWDPAIIRLVRLADYESCGVPLNATVLDHLLKNQKLVPAEWEGRDIIAFIGTIFGGRAHRKQVMCIHHSWWDGWQKRLVDRNHLDPEATLIPVFTALK